MRKVTSSLLVLTQIPSPQSPPLRLGPAGEKGEHTSEWGLKTSKQNLGVLARVEGVRFSAKGGSLPSPS